MDSFISRVRNLPHQISQGAQTALTPFKKQKESAKRIKLQKELFAFTKCTENGFPHKASAIAYDSKLSLLAIGTKTGHVRVYGAPGVEFACRLPIADGDMEVRKLAFVDGEARLIALCADNSVHLLEVNSDTETQLAYLEHVQQVSFAAKDVAPASYVTAMCLSGDGERLFCGTEGGSLIAITLEQFVHDEQFSVSYEQLTDKLSEASVKECSAVRALAVRERTLLVAFANGLTVQYDLEKNVALHAYHVTQPTLHLDWYASAQFATAHADGSYVKWQLQPASDEQPSCLELHQPSQPPTMPYGPYACNAIKKLACLAGYVIFADGMSSAQYGEKSTLTVMRGDDQVAFDFTSKLVDFAVLSDGHHDDQDNHEAHEEPHTLVVLLEEELLAVDLTDPKWRLLQNPYMHTLHSSAITCAQHLNNISESLWNRLLELGAQQNCETYSSRAWPVRGGRLLLTPASSSEEKLSAPQQQTPAPAASETAPAIDEKCEKNEKAAEENVQAPQAAEDVPKTQEAAADASAAKQPSAVRRNAFITGHEDGSILFWNASEPIIQPLYKLSTSRLFADYVGAPEERDDAGAANHDWPPFRKIGMFDPYSDDPRLAVQRILLNSANDELIVGGTAGQLLVFEFRPDASTLHLTELKPDTDAPPAEAGTKDEHSDAKQECGVIKVGVGRIDLVETDGTFVWKGHDALKLVDADTPLAFHAGFQPRIILQVHPPMPISALDVHADWHLAALGTAHGYAIVDLLRGLPLKVQTTLTPAVLQTTQPASDAAGATIGESQPQTAPATSTPQHVGKIATLRRTIRDSIRTPVRQVRRVFKRSEDSSRKRDAKKDAAKKEEVAPAAAPPSTPAGETEAQPPVPVQNGDAAPAQQPCAAEPESQPQPPPDVTLTTATQPEPASEVPSAEAAQPPATNESEVVPPADEKPAAVDPEPAPEPEPEPEPDQNKPAEQPAKTACYLTPEMRSTALVRFLTFAETFISDEKRTPTATLWIGTNGGSVQLCTISVKDGKLNEHDAAKRSSIQCELAKTLQLQHAAPIVFLALLDRDYVPLVHSSAEKFAEGHHRLLVCTEEQFKLFNAVSLKPKIKAKLNAPNRARRCALAKFASLADHTYTELALVTLTTEGQLLVADLRTLRNQLVVDDALPRGDLVALNSCFFTADAHGTYQCSPSQFATFSLSARTVNAPRCTVEPASGQRPLKMKPNATHRVTVGETLCAAAAAATPRHVVDSTDAEPAQAATTDDGIQPVAATEPAAENQANESEPPKRDSEPAETHRQELDAPEQDQEETERDHEHEHEHEIEHSRTLPTDMTMDVIVDYTKPKHIDDDALKQTVIEEHADQCEAQVVS